MSERAEQFIDDINPGLKESIRQTEEYKDLYPTAREAWQRAINIRASLIAKADAAFDEVRREAADRWELNVYWGFPLGRFTLAKLHAGASSDQLEDISKARAAILADTPAKPEGKEEER
jgi:hypothetical protein